jgi:hypothetical protein
MSRRKTRERETPLTPVQPENPFAVSVDPMRDRVAQAGVKACMPYIRGVLRAAGLNASTPEQQTLVNTLFVAVMCAGWDLGSQCEADRREQQDRDEIDADEQANSGAQATAPRALTHVEGEGRGNN